MEYAFWLYSVRFVKSIFSFNQIQPKITSTVRFCQPTDVGQKLLCMIFRCALEREECNIPIKRTLDPMSRETRKHIEIPQPTQDQRDFLEKSCLQAGVYDPTATVGGASAPSPYDFSSIPRSAMFYNQGKADRERGLVAKPMFPHDGDYMKGWDNGAAPEIDPVMRMINILIEHTGLSSIEATKRILSISTGIPEDRIKITMEG